MNMFEIGAVIREKRKSLGVSQKKVTDPLSMSRATLSNLETGNIDDLGLRKIMKICDELGLEVVVREKRQRPTLNDLIEEQRLERSHA
jgi:transcriptional regulator with XRE-family HTH domain